MSITSTAGPNCAVGAARRPAVLSDRSPLSQTDVLVVARLSDLPALQRGSASTNARPCHRSHAQLRQFPLLSVPARRTAGPTGLVSAIAVSWSCDRTGPIRHVVHRLKAGHEWLSCAQFT